MKFPVKNGVLVTDVSPFGPAAQAKLNPLDIITQINKKNVRSDQDVYDLLQDLELGQSYTIKGYGVKEKKRELTWEKGEVKIKPVTNRDLIFDTLKIEEDKVSGIKSYQHRGSAEFVNSNTDFYVRVLQHEQGDVLLRLHIQYVANDWLFLEKIIVSAGNTRFTIPKEGKFRLSDVNRDNSGGKIWEWITLPVSNAEKEMLEEMIKSEEVIVRFKGSQYFKDLKLTSEIQRIRTVLTASKILSEKKSD